MPLPHGNDVPDKTVISQAHIVGVAVGAGVGLAVGLAVGFAVGFAVG